MADGKETQALFYARKAITLRPDDAEALSLLGLCFVGKDSTRERGLDHLRRGVMAEPNEPRWHVNLGQGLIKAGRYLEAEKSFAAAAKLSDEHLGVLMQWGRALRLAGRPNQAAQIYARVISRSPTPTAWRAASEALTEAGDISTALIAYEKAYPEDERPDFAVAHLADMHISLRQYPQAAALNDKLVTKNPDDANAGLRAANLIYWSGDADGAKALLSELWFKHPFHAGIAAALLKEGNGEPRALAERIATDERFDQAQRRLCAFALCDYTDMAGETDAAWNWAVLANSLYPKKSAALGTLRDILDKALITYKMTPKDTTAADDNRATKMLYIVGPPQSGASFLQCFLERHSGVRSAGESRALINSLMQLIDDPVQLTEQAKKLATADIAAITRAAGMADYFVDRSSQAFLLAGMIAKVHVGAKFIAPHRDEKDLAVALFFHDFGDKLPFTRNMADIQEYLNFHEAALVRWREAGVNIISYNHDRFEQETKARGRALCEALGLTWSEALLGDELSRNVTAPGRGRGTIYAPHLKAAGFRS